MNLTNSQKSPSVQRKLPNKVMCDNGNVSLTIEREPAIQIRLLKKRL